MTTERTVTLKFRKKPIVIDAVQYVAYGKLVRGMCNSVSCYTAGNSEPHVHTIHDGQIALLAVGDWIIPEPDGEHFYPCKPDIFAATYEPAGTPDAAPGRRTMAETPTREQWYEHLKHLPVTFPGGGIPLVNFNHVLDTLAALATPQGGDTNG